MRTVDVTEGIEYGFRIMLYYIGVVIVGNVISGVGAGMVFAGFPRGRAAFRAEPNWGLIVLGGIIGVIGVLTIFAGIFGALYKIISDSVAKGRVMSSTRD